VARASKEEGREGEKVVRERGNEGEEDSYVRVACRRRSGGRKGRRMKGENMRGEGEEA